ncbi:MAG: alpha-2-macroglobulin, partial [Chitinophagaceae bacterium]|nr:alpha-2-macroglobulin [Chitinophagaceae bacterium]
MLLKKILLLIPLSFLLVLTTTAQKMNAYEKQWKKVDSLLEKSGLVESALKEVNQIYALAKKEKNEPQQIKALTWQIGLKAMKTDDETSAAGFSVYEKEIAASTGNTKAILQSILASQYWNYYNSHRWEIMDRTATVNFTKEDPATWSIDDFHKKIGALYLASLSNESQLQQTKLEPYNPIIHKGNMRQLRPTLFDLLANRALEYFKSDDRNITKPAYAFQIDQPEAIADVNSFVNAKFQTKDDQSLQFRALQLYQRLLKFHLNDAKPDALVDADINRLEFVNTYGVMPKKNELYKQSLEKLTSQYGQQPFATQAWFLLANYHSTLAGKYNASADTTNRYEYVKAVAILEAVLKDKTPSEGRASSFNLLQQIRQPVLGIEAEKVNLPAQNFRALVTFRNIPKLEARIIKVTDKTLQDLDNRWDEKYWQKLLQLPVLKTFTQKLPDTRDYQEHTTEIPVAGLAPGTYILLASPDEFTLNKPLAAQIFHVSNIAYISSGHNYHVLNRQSGEPIARANVQVWNRYYDYKASKYLERKGEQFVTDQFGTFAVAESKTREDNQYRFEISFGDDRLNLTDYKYNGRYTPYPNDKDQFTTFLFTDRGIYRPGQIVYVKGILVQRNADTKRSSILPNKATTLNLLDANGQKVSSMEVSTNEFGSYSARFNLPTGALNGQFSIQDTLTKSTAQFSVEEYKRPKFEVKIDQPQGTYRINETITVEGTAKAYAGNNIDGASVNYRVVRRTRFMPMYDVSYLLKIWPPRNMADMEILHGTATTDANGKFKISFQAIPDNGIDRSLMPQFDYTISADVTDINGETRSGNTNVSVAWQALVLNMEGGKELPADSLATLKFKTTNLAGSYERTTLTLNAFPLQAPQRVLRSRYWKSPDQFVLTQEEYYKLFPYDIYKDEDAPSKWQRGASVLSITDTTSSDGSFGKGKMKLPAGWYAFEMTTKDKYGEDVKATAYLLLTGGKDLHVNSYVKLDGPAAILEPGQLINYTLNSNMGKLFMIRETLRRDNNQKKDYLNFDGSAQRFTLPVTEADRGNIGLSVFTVKNNRFYSDGTLFNVPFSNKELKIDYITWRDKTLPGSQEKWKVKISGTKNEKVAAEMLTSLYDASLDQFAPFNWQSPYLYPVLHSWKLWDGTDNFTSVNADRKDIAPPYESFEKMYDQLVTGPDDYMAVSGRANKYTVTRLAAGSISYNYSPAPAAPAEARSRKMEDSVVGVVNPDGTAEDGRLSGWSTSENKPGNPPANTVRTNLNETAFFFPDLKTDADGNVEFSFTMPEALTTWKWQTLAHTKDLAFGYGSKNMVTQKELMVQPNAPRFLREGDRIDFSTKIVNLSSKELTGQVRLELIDPSTNQSVDGWFNNVMPNQYFTVAAGQSSPATFSLLIPYQYNRPLTYRVVAEAKGGDQNWTDGEQAILPVVSNRMLVTESLPLPMRGNGSKNFSFTKLQQSGNSQTLGHQSLTVEFTTNPAWYAVQSLPYLMEYPYECAEQLFNRYYANALATTIANSTPKLKAIFERWKNADTSALLSNLMKNQELKALLLEETPWVLQAQDETKQKKQIGLLFDLTRMSTELQSSLNKLKDLQSSNGGFVWFKGGPDDRFITQYIGTGIGRLRNLKALPKEATGMQEIIQAIVPYLDKKIKEDYDHLVKHKVKLADNNLGYTQIQYLYMRSFFPEFKIPAASQTAYNYYRKQSQQFWLKQSKYMQGMIAIALNRTGDKAVPKAILKSLKETAIVNEEMGMYWKEAGSAYGYFWHQAPIEKQALLIEAFKEVNNDIQSVE